jgi:hypothetical protein
MTARYVCEALKCNNPIFQDTTNPKRLCKKHEMEDRHKSATAQKPGATSRSASAQKSIDKSKLYRINPDEEMRAEMKLYRKRKRDSSDKKSASHPGPEAAALEVRPNIVSLQQLSRNSSLFDVPLTRPKTAPKRSAEDTQWLLNQAASRQKEKNVSSTSTGRLASSSVIEPLVNRRRPNVEDSLMM